MSWWLDDLNPKGLSQGDIVAQILSGAADQPVKYLEKTPLEKGSKKSWLESSVFQPFKTDNRGFYIARGRLTHAIVVSHSCELDKGQQHVLLAPIAPLDSISDEKVRNNILSQARRAFLPLPEIPGLGTCYADFRMLNFVDRKGIPDTNRMTSMSDEGSLRLRAQLLAFFSRINPDVLEAAIKNAINTENKPV